MIDVHVDIESYSEVDLIKCGTYRYAEDESTEVLMLAYSIGEKSWFFDLSQADALPGHFLGLINNPEVTFWAFHANFERVMLNEICGAGIKRERWKCSMVLANNLGFTGHLDGVVAQIGLDEKYSKQADGKKLIHRFCRPQPKNQKVARWTKDNDPEGWAKFCAYNRQDVVAETAVFDHLIAFPQPNWDDYFLDQKINDTGVAVDLDFIVKAQACAERAKADAVSEMKKITSLDNPNSVVQLLAWANNDLLAKSKDGVVREFADMTKAAVAAALEQWPLSDRLRRALELRQIVSKTSVSKLDALVRAVCADGCLRGVLQFMGAARTHRWAGRLFQPQNLPRPTVDQDEAAYAVETGKATMEQVVSVIRGAIVGYDGADLGVADLAGIEGRILPWLCFFQQKLDRIAAGEDMYKVAAVSAGLAFHVDKVTKDSRQVGKVIELACGYQGAVGAFNSMAVNYGLSLPDNAVKTLVYSWRNDNAPIVDFWADMQSAAEKAICRPGEVFEAGRCTLTCFGGFLWVKLPSGNFLSYYQPELNERGDLSYMGLNSYTRKWERISTYGGKAVENVTQAVARDILMVWLQRMGAAGYDPVLHVHDEVVFECDHEEDLQIVIDAIETPIDWAPGLPLNAEGFICARYRK